MSPVPARLGAAMIRSERPEGLAALIAFDLDEANDRAGVDLAWLGARAGLDMSQGAKALKAIAPKAALQDVLRRMAARSGCAAPLRVQASTEPVAAMVDLDARALLVHVDFSFDAYAAARALAEAFGPSSQLFLASLPPDLPGQDQTGWAVQYEALLGSWRGGARSSVLAARERLALSRLDPSPGAARGSTRL